MDETGLAGVEGQVRAEVGEGWATDERVIRGRNAVRAEHGLPPLGEPAPGPARGAAKRSVWRRLFGG